MMNVSISFKIISHTLLRKNKTQTKYLTKLTDNKSISLPQKKSKIKKSKKIKNQKIKIKKVTEDYWRENKGINTMGLILNLVHFSYVNFDFSLSFILVIYVLSKCSF